MVVDMQVFSETTGYMLTCVPDEHPEQYLMVIKVERTKPGTWAIRWHGQVLNVETREWEYEPMNSGRTDEWLATHRTGLHNALCIARELAPTLTVNGHGVRDFIKWPDGG